MNARLIVTACSQYRWVLLLVWIAAFAAPQTHGQLQIDSTVSHYNLAHGLIKKLSATDYKNDSARVFFDYEWKRCDTADAEYYTLAYTRGGIWFCEDYNIFERRAEQYVTYADRELTVMHGAYRSFHPNSKAHLSGRYVDGLREGLWKSFYEDGKLSEQRRYRKGEPMDTTKEYFTTGTLKSLTYDDSLGEGHTITFFEDGKTASQGKYDRNGGQDSTWVYYFPDGKLRFLEVYRNDSLQSVQCFNKEGKAEKNCLEDRLPEFPGGMPALRGFLSTNIQYPAGYKLINRNKATVIARFVVDKKGNVESVRIKKHLAEPFDEEVIRVLNAMPRWKPGVRHGEPVKFYYDLPVSFMNN